VARPAAKRALGLASGPTRTEALLAAGWVAHADGDRPRALTYANEVVEAARTHRDRAALAAALELAAESAADRDTARVHLLEAVEVWRAIGNPLGAATVELVLARHLGPPEGWLPLERAEEAARRIGAHGCVVEATALREAFTAAARPGVAVRTLGGFQILHDGEPVSAARWQSRKARDLVKILVARRGRPMVRTALMDALWPGEDPRKLHNRMSVALSTARGVLDPAKRFAPHHLLIAEDGAVRLDTDRLPVDVTLFLAEASRGLALRRDGRDESVRLLTRAHSRYAGDFLEGDADDDWAEPLRREARLVFLQVARALAEDALSDGDTEAAVRHLLPILERDPYDERAHLALVGTLERAGDHGEARRRYRDYVARMTELDAEPAPFPGIR
jgi:DNA-binding SARP family transcriptional activator